MSSAQGERRVAIIPWFPLGLRIGVISDTHLATPGVTLGAEIASVFAGVDLIIHTGDVYQTFVLDELEWIAPVLCARGNGDTDPAFDADPRVAVTHLVEAEGRRVGAVHALVYPETHWRSLEASMEFRFGGRVDAIVFGDSHSALVERHNGVLLVNPGSPTLPDQLIGVPGSVAILDVCPDRVDARLVWLTTAFREL